MTELEKETAFTENAAGSEKPDAEEVPETPEVTEDPETAESPETAEAPDSTEETPEQGGKEKKKLFGRNDKLEKALKESETRNAELTDLLQRQMAEFDNFRKRSEKEKAAQFDLGARNVLEKLLPIVDSFERGLGGLTEEAKEQDAFAAGMDKVYRQTLKMLEDLDVKPIEALDKPFDANLHYAVMHEENPELGEGIITQELQKGYTYRGTVIRYSMVKVAN